MLNLSLRAAWCNAPGLQGVGPTCRRFQRMSATSRQADENIANEQVAAAAAAEVPLGDRYRVFPGRRLAHLALPCADAVAAEDQSPNGPTVYALLCRPGIPWRASELATLHRNVCPGVLQVLASGPLALSPRQRRFAILLRRPEGGPLLPREGEGAPVPEGKVLKTLLPQLFEALRGLAARGLTHRAIRPDNVHYLDAVREQVVLGPLVAGPPGRDQPLVYEPIESAMAHADGRGVGTAASDLYALGVTLLAVVTGRNPAAGWDDAELLAERVGRGSYRTLVGNERYLSLEMTALLRGLLCDDPGQRWTLETLGAWLDGSGQAIRPPIGAHNASQAFEFNQRSYAHPRLLAAAFAREPAGAIDVFRGNTLGPWLRNAVRAPEAAERLAALKERAAKILASSAAGESILAAAICQALDPSGPVRFRRLSVMPDGLGPMLAAVFASGDRDRLKDFGSLFSCGYLGALAGTQAEASHRGSSKDRFGSLRTWAMDTRSGAGLERCLYELNSGLPCQSPLVADSCVLDLAGLVGTLDRVAEGAEARRTLLDRHVTAFVASRTRKLDPALAELGWSAGAEGAATVAPLKVLAELQRLYAQGPVPNLVEWSLHRLKPTVAALRNRTRRERLGKALERAAAAGDLNHMLKILNHGRTAAVDEREYQAARRRYAALGDAVRKVRAGVKRRQARSVDHSFTIVVLVSYVAMIASAGYVAYTYLGDLL